MTHIATHETSKTDGSPTPRRRLLLTLPVIGFTGLAAVFAWGIGRDPNQLPSALIGKEVPWLALRRSRAGPLVSQPRTSMAKSPSSTSSPPGASPAGPSTRCSCASLGTNPFSIHGLNYKDRPQDAAKWLNTLADSYTRTGADRDGQSLVRSRTSAARSCCSMSGRPDACRAERRCRHSTGCRRPWVGTGSMSSRCRSTGAARKP